MNRYEPRTPRAFFGVAAVALTLLTLGVFVAVPASLDSGAAEPTLLAAPESVAPGLIEVTIIPSRIEVFGVREPTVATAQSGVAPRQTKNGS